jgi:hypothetical protein
MLLPGLGLLLLAPTGVSGQDRRHQRRNEQPQATTTQQPQTRGDSGAQRSEQRAQWEQQRAAQQQAQQQARNAQRQTEQQNWQRQREQQAVWQRQQQERLQQGRNQEQANRQRQDFYNRQQAEQRQRNEAARMEQWQRRQQQEQLARQRNEQFRYQNSPYYGRGSVYNNSAARRYRIYRNGRYYQTDQNGVNILQQAVNYGYQQGIRAGRDARARGFGYNFQDALGYQNGYYGYNGVGVDQDQYDYYYQEGLRRGYEDGYNSRWQYGSESNGGISILASILGQLLNFQAY